MKGWKRFLWAVALTAAIVAPVRAESTEFTHAGGPCFQGALALSAPIRNVREFVPPEFPLIQAAGRAGLFAYTVECGSVSVNGGPASTATLTGVAAFVRPPDGSPGVQAYDILMTADREDYVAAHEELGLLMGNVTVGFEVTSILGPLVHVVAETPWAYSPYAWTLTAVRGPAQGMPLTTVHWQDGSRGRVLIEYAHTELNVTPGIGAIRAAPGSPLARLLGAEQQIAAGAILRFSYTGTVTLQP